nr:response regulator transcription factor [Geodermatophilus sabuli]
MLADSHPVVRRVLVDLFEETDDITVVGECGSGEELLPTAIRTRPHVVLVDPTLPGTDPLEAVRELLDVLPSARIAVHAGAFCLVTSHRAQRLGAVGYLLKGDDLADLPQRVRELADGGSVWCAPPADRGR